MTVSRRDVHRLAAAAAASAALLPGALGAVAAAQDGATFEPLGSKGTEPLGGQPVAGAKRSVTDFDYQIKYHRAFEAVLWNMPAIAIYSFRRAAFDTLGI